MEGSFSKVICGEDGIDLRVSIIIVTSGGDEIFIKGSL